MAGRSKRATPVVDYSLLWCEPPGGVSTMPFRRSPRRVDPLEGERGEAFFRWYVLDSEAAKEAILERLRDEFHVRPLTATVLGVDASASAPAAGRVSWTPVTFGGTYHVKNVFGKGPCAAKLFISAAHEPQSRNPGLLQARLPSLRSSLEQLRSLPADWNGYGAEPPSENAICQADRLLSMLEDHHPLPSRVSPSAEGGIGVFFLSETKRYAWVEFFNDGEAVAATSDGDGQVDAWAVLTDDETTEAMTLEETLERIGAFLSAPA